jgi:endoglucanase
MAHGAMWSLLEKAAKQGISFIVFMFVARMIGPKEYGLANRTFEGQIVPRSNRIGDRTIGVAAAALFLACFAAGLARADEIGNAATEATGWMPGVNLSGAELNAPKTRLNFDYIYPTTAEIDYFVGKGLTTFRIPVLSDRLLGPSREGPRPLTRDWIVLLKLIDHTARSHARVIVDFHQYGAMPSGLIGRDTQATRDFAQAWAEVAGRLKDRPNVIFGLMNEPHEQNASEWLVGANAAIAAIRNAGARQLIFVPGSYWTGAHSWTKTDNGKVMAGVVDPINNFAYEVHQYLDSDSSGTKPEVIAGAGATRLVDFTNWARQHHAKGFLGEMGWAATPEGQAEGRALVTYMADNRDVWRGWTYWAAGPWWGEYMFSVELSKTGDRAQMDILTNVK